MDELHRDKDCALPANEDAGMPQDIEKRFQHLVNQWFTFQKRAGFLELDKEALINFGITKVHPLPREEQVRSAELKHLKGGQASDARNSVSKYEEAVPAREKAVNEQEQVPQDDTFNGKEEQLRKAEKHLLGEQKRLSNARNTLRQHEEAVCRRERAVKEHEKAVAESGTAALVSMVESNKRAAELLGQESTMEDERQKIDALDIKLKWRAQELQDEKEALKKDRDDLEDKRLCFEAEVKEFESQRVSCKREMEEIKLQKDLMQQQGLADAKNREASKHKEEILAAREHALLDIEKELECKCIAIDNLSRKLNAREKLLRNIQKQTEEERLQVCEALNNLETEKKSIDEAKTELEISKRNVDDEWEHISAERKEAAEFIKSADERLKTWEERLKQREKELLQQQEFLKGFEAQVKSEQQRCHMLHSNVQKEQEIMANDLKNKEESFRKREILIERKEEEVKKSLQKLVEKRNLADAKLKQLKEVEARTEASEEELHKRHQEHLQKVEQHTKDYQAQLDHLETLKHDLEHRSSDIDRRFQEARTAKKELKLWQKEAEEALDNQAEILLKEKKDLQSQKQHLKYLQHEIEKAGGQMIDHMMNLDQACSKMGQLQHRLCLSQQKLQKLADHITKQQNLLKDKEKNVFAKEQQLETAQNEWEKRNMEVISKEEKLNLKEQTLKSREDSHTAKEEDLYIREQALKKREDTVKDFELKMVVAESSQHKNIVEKQKLQKERLEMLEMPDIEHPKQGDVISLSMEAESRQSKLEKHSEASNLELIQLEAAKIIKERESLKAQQHELEETKNAVQDAKLTLAAQLRATKEMVVDASMTAQKASREREALEQERKRLAKAQKEIEVALTAREARLSLAEQKLEKEKRSLEEERERAREIIHKAGQVKKLVDAVETSGNRTNSSDHNGAATKAMLGIAHSSPSDQHGLHIHHFPGMSHGESSMEHCFQMLETPTMPHANTRYELDMINLWREEECAKIEREEKMIMDEISKLHNQHEGGKIMSSLNNMAHESDRMNLPIPETDEFQIFHGETGPIVEPLQAPSPGTFDGRVSDIFKPLLDEQSDGFYSESEAAFPRDLKLNSEVLQVPKEHYDHFDDNADVISIHSRLYMTRESKPKTEVLEMPAEHYDHFDDNEDVMSSHNRLEHVMQSLINARQASRSRLQRTKNLLKTLPLSAGGLVLEVQRALDALTDRLSLMEQIEDELTDELREAYGLKLPDSEGMIVDKVELLCRMEEQQGLRAEWEEDMQCQLEKISILQANTQASPCFSTPVKRTIFDRIVSPPSSSSPTK